MVSEHSEEDFSSTDLLKGHSASTASFFFSFEHKLEHSNQWSRKHRFAGWAGLKWKSESESRVQPTDSATLVGFSLQNISVDFSIKTKCPILLSISRWISYFRSLLSEFASLPLMHPPVSAWPAPWKLLFVKDSHLRPWKPQSPLFLQAIQSDPVCNVALKDQYLSLCCLTTTFSRTQHTVKQWTERLNICRSFHKSIRWSRIQINIDFLCFYIESQWRVWAKTD